MIGFKVEREDYEMHEWRYRHGQLKIALAKIADPRLRDHKEPDAPTELGCVMNIANEALIDDAIYVKFGVPSEVAGEVDDV